MSTNRIPRRADRPRLPTDRGSTGRGAPSPYGRLAKGLGLFSIGLGLAELLAARGLCRALGMEGRENLVRAYGARELATGVAILTSHDPTPWIFGRVAGDAIDLATLATGFEGDNPRRGNLLLATAAVAGVAALDVVCAQGLVSEQRPAPAGTWDCSDRRGFPQAPPAMRGAAADFAVPADFRIPEALRPWRDGGPATRASV